MASVQTRVLLTCILALYLLPGNAHGEWTTPATRSGAGLPEKGHVDVLAAFGGLYARNSQYLPGKNTGIANWFLIWNYSLVKGLGLFGGHDIYGMWWNNLSFLAFGHEVGLRLLKVPHLAFEAAYLTHRIEYQWIDGEPYSLGGLHDHGFEAAAIIHFAIAGRLKLETSFLGRFFGEPKSETSQSYTDQVVYGMGLKTAFLIFKNWEIETDLKLLRVDRGPTRRSGVDEVTWNVIGKALARFAITPKFGIFAAAKASTSFWCGEIPMLEIKRSMINEPTAQVVLGVFFTI